MQAFHVVGYDGEEARQMVSPTKTLKRAAVARPAMSSAMPDEVSRRARARPNTRQRTS